MMKTSAALPCRLVGAACLVLTTFLLAGRAMANVGPPSWGGQLVAEPTGLENVLITRETLAIDLRPLAQGEPAHVEAVYQLDNHGSQRKLDLVFASGSALVTDFQVWLADQSVPSTPAEPGSLPESWQPPKQTPGIQDDRGINYLAYGKRQVTPLGFSVVLAPGPQALKVRYRAEAAKHHYGRPTVYWQFAYVLAPVRMGWLRRPGRHYSPARKLARRMYPRPAARRRRPPCKFLGTACRCHCLDGPGARKQGLSGAGLWKSGCPGPGGCGRSDPVLVGRLVKGPSSAGAWPRALVLAGAWGVTIFAAGFFAVEGPSLALPAFQENTYGYGAAFAMLGVILLSILALPVGFGICLITADIVARRAASKTGRAQQPRGSSEEGPIGEATGRDDDPVSGRR